MRTEQKLLTFHYTILRVLIWILKNTQLHDRTFFKIFCSWTIIWWSFLGRAVGRAGLGNSAFEQKDSVWNSWLYTTYLSLSLLKLISDSKHKISEKKYQLFSPKNCCWSWFSNNFPFTKVWNFLQCGKDVISQVNRYIQYDYIIYIGELPRELPGAPPPSPGPIPGILRKIQVYVKFELKPIHDAETYEFERFWDPKEVLFVCLFCELFLVSEAAKQKLHFTSHFASETGHK